MKVTKTERVIIILLLVIVMMVGYMLLLEIKKPKEYNRHNYIQYATSRQDYKRVT